MRDKPWIFRTYAGHSTAVESNALYRKNLARRRRPETASMLGFIR
jgi:methylmalonyl-CoA mutase N-terminal domain/subunit